MEVPPEAIQKLTDAMGSLPARIGTGKHEQGIVMGILQGLRGLALDVQDLKSVIYRSWEGPPDWKYTTLAMEYKHVYIDHCRKAKGTGKDLGHQKNYIALGMYLAFMADETNGKKEKEEMEMLFGKKLRNREGKLDITMVKEISPMVGYCRVTQTKKNSFFSLLFRGPEGERMQSLLERALEKEGKRQWDPSVPDPVHKDLREALEQARKKSG